MEEINLSLGSPKLNVSGDSDGGTIKISMNDAPKKSVNFGPGAEMLMNQSFELKNKDNVGSGIEVEAFEVPGKIALWLEDE